MTALADPISFAASQVRERSAALSKTACAHCGTPMAADPHQDPSHPQFCCGGCEAVFHTLRSCGLDAYYRLRDGAAEGAPNSPANVVEEGVEAFDSPAFHETYVIRHADGLASVDLALEGLTCAACVWLVEKLPQVVPGVVDARLSFRTATVRLTWDPARTSLSKAARALARLGYRPHPTRGAGARAAEMHRRDTRRRLVNLGVAGALMGNTMLLAIALYAGDFGHMESPYRSFFRWLSAGLGLTSLLWPGFTFFRSAWNAIRLHAVNLDVPIALALVVGGGAGLVNVVLNRGEIYFDSLSVLVFLLLVGRFVQYRQQRRADDAIGLLFSLTPATCHIVRDDGRTEEAPVEALREADLFEVRPGELFPADGEVVRGASTVNQALLTGESLPIAVDAGASVFAGSQNVASPLIVRTRSVGGATRVGRLMGLIEQGVRDKPPIVQFADKVGAWFVVFVSLAAAGVFAFWIRRAGLERAIDHTVALLIVTCPCVLGLATPLTIAVAIGRLSRRDILVKSGAALERLSRGGRLLLDKTGTLTQGQSELLLWAGADAHKGVDLRRAVAALEAKSNHPVGRALAVALHAGDGGPAVLDLVERNNGGVAGTVGGLALSAGSVRYMRRANAAIPAVLADEAEASQRAGATAVMIAVDNEVVAVASLGERVRPDAASAIDRLKRFGWKPEILSGDAQGVVASVAAQIGVPTDAAHGELSPEEKLSRVHRTSADNEPIVMVGDGVNDAAALAAAEIGIAVRGGAEASLSAADVYIARNGLSPLVELVETSRRTMRTVHRNLLVSLGYNLLAGTLAAAGLMSPLIAAIIMPISSGTILSLVVLSVGRANSKSELVEGASWK